MSRLPIRFRLTLAFAVVMAVVFAAVGAILYVRLGDTLDERIADELESRGAALVDAVRAGEADGLDPSVFRSEEGVVQVIGRDGRGLFPSGDPTLTAADLARARAGVVTLEAGGFRIRAEPVDGRVFIVGELLEDRDEALDALLAQLLVVLPLALLVSSAIGYLVAGAALRPMEAMRREAEEVSSTSSGRRLPLPEANDEVRRLGETLNEMLERLDAGLERERQFVADASHELRTPLAILKAELELALRQPRSAEELRAALGSALDETDRLARLADDLLVVARADRGALHVDRGPAPVDELLERVATRFARMTDGRAVVVERSALVVDADPARIEQAVGNLVDNALRHGAGTVTLAAVESAAGIELHVADEGSGFDLAFLPDAFERFSRADEARSSGGAGLGLAIVRAIAVAHGGSAGARNRENGGADVWLALPSRLNAQHAPRGDRLGVD